MSTDTNPGTQYRDAHASAKAAAAYAKASRPWYAKKRFWLLGLVGIIIAWTAISGAMNSGASSPALPGAPAAVNAPVIADAPNTDAMTVSQRNAVGKAQSYLSFSAFSKEGLVAQLEYEEFSTEDAEFAVENINADWNEQAAKKAKSYTDMSSFSRAGLIKQLEFEKFTAEQAEHGATSVGLT